MTILAQKHRAQAVKRRNFLPTLPFTILLWILLAGLVYFVDPGMFGAIPAFFVLFFSIISEIIFSLTNWHYSLAY